MEFAPPVFGPQDALRLADFEATRQHRASQLALQEQELGMKQAAQLHQQGQDKAKFLGQLGDAIAMHGPALVLKQAQAQGIPWTTIRPATDPIHGPLGDGIYEIVGADGSVDLVDSMRGARSAASSLEQRQGAVDRTLGTKDPNFTSGQAADQRGPLRAGAGGQGTGPDPFEQRQAPPAEMSLRDAQGLRQAPAPGTVMGPPDEGGGRSMLDDLALARAQPGAQSGEVPAPQQGEVGGGALSTVLATPPQVDPRSNREQADATAIAAGTANYPQIGQANDRMNDTLLDKQKLDAQTEAAIARAMRGGKGGADDLKKEERIQKRLDAIDKEDYIERAKLGEHAVYKKKTITTILGPTTVDEVITAPGVSPSAIKLINERAEKRATNRLRWQLKFDESTALPAPKGKDGKAAPVAAAAPELPTFEEGVAAWSKQNGGRQPNALQLKEIAKSSAPSGPAPVGAGQGSGQRLTPQALKVAAQRIKSNSALLAEVQDDGDRRAIEALNAP